MPRDDLGHLDKCRDCGAVVARVYMDELRRHLDVDLPRPCHDVPADSLAWGWRQIGPGVGWFTTHWPTAPDHDRTHPTYVAHPCGVKRKRGKMTAPNPFGTAGAPGASGPPMEELEGKLLLIDVHAIERGIVTSNGPADAVKCSAVELELGVVHADAALWGKVLVPQFTAGTKYVGRIVKGQAQPGKNAPWQWADGTADDQAKAVAYLNYVAAQSVNNQATPPATAPPPAAPAQPAYTPPAAAAAAPGAPPWAQ